MVKTNFSKSQGRLNFGLFENKTTIGLLPGSRTAEITKLLPEMMRAAQIISEKIPNTQFILPLADTLEEKTVAGIISSSGVTVKIVSGCTYDAISCCDLVIVTSGTATLETGLLGIPMVIIYKVSLLSALVGRMVINVKNIGLVNIIAGKTIVPELIQSDAHAQRIAAEALAILLSETKRGKIIEDLAAVRSRLGSPGAARRAAQIACNML
jgi:lipid-A-disaccharide synthase